MLFKNTAQKIHVYAYDSTTGLPKTGDALNITGYVSLDGTANAIDDTNPAEVDATNMPGVYAFDLTAAETNCDSFALIAKSVTANIRLIPIIGFTTAGAVPAAVAGAAGGLFIAGTNAATSITTALTANITGNLSGSVGSVTGAVGSVTGAVGSVTGAVGSVTGSVGSVTGAVGSVTGAVGSVTAGVTVTTNNDKTGYSLTATTGLGNQTSNITGNLSGSVGSVTAAITLPTMPTDWMTAAGLAADAVTEIQSGLATAANQAAIAAYIDTETAAILAAVDTEVATIVSELAKVPKSDGTSSWNATALAALQSEANDALVAWGKTGFSLAAAGLALITADEPTAKPTTFPGWLMWLVQRHRRASKTTASILTLTEAGATVTTQTITDDGAGTETLGAPS